MITVLKVFFSILLAWMCYTVFYTSIHSNLFKEWDFLGSIPWMRATLQDFYANIIIIYLWICYKEKGIFPKIMWLVLLVALGSIASISYVLIQLFKLRRDQGLKEFFILQND
ncbi:hypothetical protein BH09BAC6_BH09BAC6_34210 [soil metagenome]|jgi:hypothetical protein